MAIQTVFTTQLVPFPVQKQRRTLEPDGLAYVSGQVDGDGSGGNNQIIIRAPRSHLYILRSLSLQHDGATTMGNQAVTLFPLWLQEATTFTATTGFMWITTGVQTQYSATVWGMESNRGGDLPLIASDLLLGSMRPGTTNNIMVVDFDNLNTQADRVTALFTAYRREALTIPGFLQMLRGLPERVVAR